MWSTPAGAGSARAARPPRPPPGTTGRRRAWPRSPTGAVPPSHPRTRWPRSSGRPRWACATSRPTSGPRATASASRCTTPTCGASPAAPAVSPTCRGRRSARSGWPGPSRCPGSRRCSTRSPTRCSPSTSRTPGPSGPWRWPSGGAGRRSGCASRAVPTAGWPTCGPCSVLRRRRRWAGSPSPGSRPPHGSGRARSASSARRSPTCPCGWAGCPCSSTGSSRWPTTSAPGCSSGPWTTRLGCTACSTRASTA